jgi:uncharacterized glyoxalase superfamily protein PhnB
MEFPSKQSALLMNRSMPSGVVIPTLAYPDVRVAVEWLCRAFGFVERLRIGDHRSQLSFGEGAVVVTRLRIEPDTSFSAGCGHSVMVRVTNVDEHCERARQSGARIISPPADYPYGERQYTAQDLGGNVWTFSQSIADIDPKDWGGALLE